MVYWQRKDKMEIFKLHNQGPPYILIYTQLYIHNRHSFKCWLLGCWMSHTWIQEVFCQLMLYKVSRYHNQGCDKYMSLKRPLPLVPKSTQCVFFSPMGSPMLTKFLCTNAAWLAQHPAKEIWTQKAPLGKETESPKCSRSTQTCTCYFNNLIHVGRFCLGKKKVIQDMPASPILGPVLGLGLG